MNVSKASCTLAAIGLCIAGFGIGVSMGLTELPGLLEAFVTTAVATVVAAFAGTRFAFKFQNEREDKIAKENEIKAARNIENCLYMQHSILKHIKSSILDKSKDDPLHYINLKAVSEIRVGSSLHNTDTFKIFALTSWDILPRELFVAEHNFMTSVGYVNERSQYMVRNIYPLLAKDFPSISEWNDNILLDNLGAEVYGRLTSYSRNIYKFNDGSLLEYQRLRGYVYRALNEMFPEQTFLNPEDDEA